MKRARISFILALLTLTAAAFLLQPNSRPERPRLRPESVVVSSTPDNTRLTGNPDSGSTVLPATQTVAGSATPNASIRMENGLARISHPTYSSEVTRNGLEFRKDGASLRFRRGTAVSIQRTDKDTLELLHVDGVREVIDVHSFGLEQSFVFDRPEKRIVVEGSLSCDLSYRHDPQPGAGVTFLSKGRPVLVYRKAVVLDAAGRKRVLPILFDGARVRIEVPDEWLREAEFPVVVDPIIAGPGVVDSGVTEGGIGLNIAQRDGVWDGNQYIITYQTTGNLAHVLRVDADGQPIGASYSFAGFAPRIAYSPSADLSLVVWNYQGAVWAQAIASNGQPIGAPILFSGTGLAPDVAWANGRFFVVWTTNGTTIGRFLNDSGLFSGLPIDVCANYLAGNGNYGRPVVSYVSGVWMVATRSDNNSYVVQLVNDSTSFPTGGPIPIYDGAFTKQAMLTARPDTTDPRVLFTVTDTFITTFPTFMILSNLRGRLIDPSGGLSSFLEWDTVADDFFMETTGMDYSPSADEFLVSHSVNLGNSASQDIRVQRVAGDGSAAAASESVELQTGTSGGNTSVVAGADSRFLVLYTAANGTDLLGAVFATQVLPTVSITNPTNGGTVTTSPALVQGTAAAPGATLTSISWVNSTNNASGSIIPPIPNWNTIVPVVAGSNTVTVTVTDSNGQSSSDTITFTMASATLQTAPASLTFNAVLGAPLPAGQVVTITNAGTGSMSWTATSSASWLSVSPSSGTTTTSTTATVSVGFPAGGSGVYNGDITIDAGTAGSETISVTLILDDEPTISLTPTALGFTATAGSGNPADQTVTVSNGGGGTLNWSITENASWLSVTPGSGTGTGTLTVSVDTTGLAVGVYSETVDVSDPLAGNSPQSFSVTLTVNTAPVPVIGLSSSVLAFNGTAGGANPSTQTVSVTNSGSGTINWSASSNSAWLSVSPASGTGAGTLTVAADLSGLAAGTYSGAITVIDPAASNSPQTISVTLTVIAAPSLAVSPPTLSFSAPVGGSNPAAQTITVSNTGGGSLSWNASDDATWLSLTPTTGTPGAGASQAMTASVSTSGLAVGVYNGTVTVTGGGSSEIVNVTFTVNGVPAIGLSPTSLSFSAPQGGPNPAFQNVSVSNTGTGSMTWSASTTAGWLSLVPSGGTLSSGASQNMAISIDVSGLAPGSFSGVVTVTAPGATNSPQSITVSLSVNALPQITLGSGSISFAAPVGGPNPIAQNQTISNTGGGVLNWAATSSETWLTLAPAGGSLAAGAGETMVLSADVSGLAAGSYPATVTVTDAGAANSPQTFSVTLTVNAVATIQVTPATLAFSAPNGGPNPLNQSILMTNTGSGTLNWTATSNAGWLGVTPASGSIAAGASQSADVPVDVTGLADGTYNALITITDPASSNVSQTVSVTLIVSSAPVIFADAGSFTFDATAGGASPLPQSLLIRNDGGGTLNWTAVTSGTWLSVAPGSGSLGSGAEEIVDVNVDSSQLPIGVHTTLLLIEDPAAANSPVVIQITLNVTAAAAGSGGGGSDGGRCGSVGLDLMIPVALLWIRRRFRRSRR